MKFLTPFLIIGATLLPLLGCHSPAQPTFDVPSLLGKDIKGVQAELGTPSRTNEHGVLAKLQGSDDAFKRWDRATAALVVHYSANTGKVRHLLLDGSRAPEGSFKSEEEALNQGNLQRGDARYSLDFINLNTTARVWMVRITPKE